jgi:hypothetical protein
MNTEYLKININLLITIICCTFFTLITVVKIATSLTSINPVTLLNSMSFSFLFYRKGMRVKDIYQKITYYKIVS